MEKVPGIDQVDLKILGLLMSDATMPYTEIAKKIHVSSGTVHVRMAKMEEMGMKAKDLEPLIGSKGHVSSVLSGRREITLKMAQKLKDFFRIPAEVFLHKAE